MNNLASRVFKANKRKDWGTCTQGNTNWKTNSPKVLGLACVKGSTWECSSGESSRLVSWLPPLMSWFHHPGKSNTSSFATVITGWPRSVSFSTSRRGVPHKEDVGSKAIRRSASRLFRDLLSFRFDWTLRSQFWFSWCVGMFLKWRLWRARPDCALMSERRTKALSGVQSIKQKTLKR